MDAQLSKKGRKIVAIGLLLVVLPNLLKEYFFISGFYQSFILLIGISIELYGLYLTKKSGYKGIFCRKNKI